MHAQQSLHDLATQPTWCMQFKLHLGEVLYLDCLITSAYKEHTMKVHHNNVYTQITMGYYMHCLTLLMSYYDQQANYALQWSSTPPQ